MSTATETAEDFIARKNREWQHNRRRKIKDVGRQGFSVWEREAWTWRVQSTHRNKTFVVEHWRLVALEGPQAYVGEGARPGDVEYRIGYWIVGRIGRAEGKWTWGQYAPMFPAADLAPLLA